MRRQSIRHPELVHVDYWVTCVKCGEAVKDEDAWRVHRTGTAMMSAYGHSFEGPCWRDRWACMKCAPTDAAALRVLGLSDEMKGAR